MDTNTLPPYDMTDSPTGCCPRFDPAPWDGQDLHFADKTFLRARTHNLMHIPIDMGRVFSRVQRKGTEAGAFADNDIIVLSRDTSPWSGEHLFAVSKPVADEEMVTLSGDFVTKVFEGPYRNAKDWYEEMQTLVRDHGKEPSDIYFFYTTCPKCAKAYGKNYVVGVARI